MNYNSLGTFIAYVLRHNPEAAGIELDGHGWASVEELIKGVNRAGKRLDMKELEELVATDGKNRFSFNGDKSKIRANQGHSFPVDLELEDKTPPDILYHGTAEKYLESIKQNGIERRARNYVHLSLTEQTAAGVGARHGTPVILKIDAAKMHGDGFKFYLSANGVWLTDFVPFKYVIGIIANID